VLRNIIYVVVLIAGLGCLYAVLNAWSPPVNLATAEHDSVTGPIIAAAAPSQAQSPSSDISAVGAALNRHLLIMGPDGNMHGFGEDKMSGVKYWAFYHSASWCPPCRAFTPRLVEFYNSFKPSHPNFELVFVSADQNDSDMTGYMKLDSMPWPAVNFAENDNPALGVKKYFGPGIPCLVLVDAAGKVLSDSYENGQYVGADHVIDDITQMVQ
jgi:nucleoredoxin